MAVRQRYEALLPREPEKMQEMLDNFDRMLSHPDTEDLVNLERAVAAHRT